MAEKWCYMFLLPGRSVNMMLELEVEKLKCQDNEDTRELPQPADVERNWNILWWWRYIVEQPHGAKNHSIALRGLWELILRLRRILTIVSNNGTPADINNLFWCSSSSWINRLLHKIVYTITVCHKVWLESFLFVTKRRGNYNIYRIWCIVGQAPFP